MSEAIPTIKLVTVGDSRVGKTTLLWAYARELLGSTPDSRDQFCGNVRFGETLLSVGVWGTAGQEEYDRLRPLSYCGTDVFLICFDVVSHTSFANVTTRWRPELQKYCPKAKFVLCGLKIDLRTDADTLIKLARVHQVPITPAQGSQLADQIGALAYFEICAPGDIGVKECFEDVLSRWFANTFSPRRRQRLFDGFLSGLRPRLRNNSNSSSNRCESFSFNSGASGNSSSSASSSAAWVEPPPRLPERSAPPSVELHSRSVFHEERASLVGLALFSDVDLFVEGQCIPAHRALLCAGSELWRRVLMCSSESADLEINRRRAMRPAIAAFAERREPNSRRIRIAIALGSEVTHVGTMAMLHFVYTGSMPKLSRRDLKSARQAAVQFALPEMEHWCCKVDDLRDRSFTSVESTDWRVADDHGLASTTTRHMDAVAAWARSHLINKQRFADVACVIECDGEVVFGHRALLHAHSPVMARQFEGRFADGRMAANGASALVRTHVGGVTSAVFVDLLEFTCCGSASSLVANDAVELLQLADRYNMPILRRQCEHSISVELMRTAWERVLRSDIDVVGLLITAERHNAKQLSMFLRYFIAAHFHSIKALQADSWSQLEEAMPPDVLEFITQRKWPPPSYLKSLAAFESRSAAESSSSSSSFFARLFDH